MLSIQEDFSIELHSRVVEVSNSSLKDSTRAWWTAGKSPRNIRNESFMSGHSGSNGETWEGEQMLKMRVLLDQQHFKVAMKAGRELLSGINP